MRQTSDVLKMFSCVGLDCEIRAHFISRRLAPKAHTDSTDSTKKRRISVFYKPQISTNFHKLFLFNLLNLCELFHQQIRICVRIGVLNDVKKREMGGGGGEGSLRKSEIYR